MTLPTLPAKLLRASVLTGGDATPTQSADRIEIAVVAPSRNEIDTIVVLRLVLHYSSIDG
jgi:hypothetical protein